jgi:hypothetical protein
MGLLDDAIREHLELKRRRGADPGEVARQEHEALASGSGRQAPSPGDLPAGAGGWARSADGDADVQPAEDLATPAAREQDPEAGAGAAFPASLQETAELDMDNVFGEEGAVADASAPPAAARRDDWFRDDSLGAHGDVPGQESFHFE